jgi:hypothetical protein
MEAKSVKRCSLMSSKAEASSKDAIIDRGVNFSTNFLLFSGVLIGGGSKFKIRNKELKLQNWKLNSKNGREVKV